MGNTATARAVVDSELGFIPASRVMEMLERSPSHMHATMKLLALEVARMREIIASPPDHLLLHLVENGMPNEVCFLQTPHVPPSLAQCLQYLHA